MKAENNTTYRTYKDMSSGITVKAVNRGVAWLIIRKECYILNKKPPCFNDVIELLETTAQIQ